MHAIADQRDGMAQSTRSKLGNHESQRRQHRAAQCRGGTRAVVVRMAFLMAMRVEVHRQIQSLPAWFPARTFRHTLDSLIVTVLEAHHLDTMLEHNIDFPLHQL